MADIRIAEVRVASTQPAGGVVPVRLYLNNNELAAPFPWEDSACKTEGTWGHTATTSLTVTGPTGTTVFEDTKDTCVPKNRLSEQLGANQIVTFEPQLDNPGVYRLQSTVTDTATDTTQGADPVTVKVVEPEQAARATDDESATNSNVGEEIGEELGGLVGASSQEYSQESREQNTGGSRNDTEGGIGKDFAAFVRENPGVAAGVGVGGVVALKFALPP